MRDDRLGEDKAKDKGEKKSKEKKGKRVRTGRKHESMKVYKYFSVKDGKAERLKKSCPRCGSGTFMAMHKDRLYCGRCRYTIFKK